MSLRLALAARPKLMHALQGALADADVKLCIASNADGLRQVVSDCEAVALPIYHYDAHIAEAMRRNANLRWIQFLTVGTERLRTLPPPAGVLVTTAGSSMAATIAEHAMALVLALSRQLHALLGSNGQPVDPREAIQPLGGKRVAVVGYGAIGREIAIRAKGFGLQVCGVRRTAQQDGIADEVRALDDLGPVLAASDIVIIAAPLTPETHGLLDGTMLARCKRGALVVNVSRGPVIDSEALAALLASGYLGGAGLDVTEPEPLPPDHILARLPNVILTPHIAAAGSEAPVAHHVAANVRRFIAGEPLEAVFSP